MVKMMMVSSEELRKQMIREAEEERRLKEEEREIRRKNDDFTGKPSGDSSLVGYSCPHCSFKAKASNKLALQLFYCKRCGEVQTQPIKQVVETVTEKEYRGFWQWLLNKPAITKRSIHAEIVPRSPQCFKCKRTDMMVPFDNKHCPACGNLLERNDDSWF